MWLNINNADGLSGAGGAAQPFCGRRGSAVGDAQAAVAAAEICSLLVALQSLSILMILFFGGEEELELAFLPQTRLAPSLLSPPLQVLVLAHEMANVTQISKDELEELREAFAKVGEWFGSWGGGVSPVCQLPKQQREPF